MFTTENTVNELLSHKDIVQHFDYLMPSFFLNLVPEDLRDLPMEELSEKLTMPWGVPYIAKEVVQVCNQLIALKNTEKYEFVKLWSDETPIDYFPSSDGSRDGVGLLLLKDSFSPRRKLALICPGGAYTSVAVAIEGLVTADALEKAGYAVGILNYRCAPNRYPIPQEDLALAIKRLKAIARERGMDAELLTVGFSAGGHLLASETCYYKEIESSLQKKLDEGFPVLAQETRNISAKSDKVCLSYPVINFLTEQHEDSFINLTDGQEQLRDKLSIDKHVTSDYPKTFLWACRDDELVPVSNTTRMFEALKAVDVVTQCSIYPTGGHGIATGEGTSAVGWIDELVSFMSD